MKKFGLIGCPLSHSYSQTYFQQFFKEHNLPYHYELYEIPQIDIFNELILKEKNLYGLNVTIPYKVSIIPLLNELDETAQIIGAVNVVKIYRSNNKIITKGFNTDYQGFLKSLPQDISLAASKSLILGTGGAAKAVAYAFKTLGIESYFVSRLKRGGAIIQSDDLTDALVSSCRFIVNATPIGMYPNFSDVPAFPFDLLNETHIVIDLIYNPEVTEFLNKAKEKNAYICNGKNMLYHQAQEAWQIWDNDTIV